MIIQYLHAPFPVIEVGDIILRELTEDDTEDYFNYMSRPEMSACLVESNFPSTMQHALEEVRYWGGLFRNKRSFYWAIALRDTNKLIGTAGFNNISIVNLRAEISYDLDYNFWGKGIMLKSIKAILKFADNSLGIVRTQATVITDNQRSRNVLERCGFNAEGLLKKYEVVKNVHKDYLMYARVR
jgi:[ribosomal protein S5]-alanine N-acetyltransferase